MQASHSDRFTVTAVVSKQPSSHPWLDVSWSLLGFLPGIDEAKCEEAAQTGSVIQFPELTIQLHKEDCQAYYHNLMSAQPKAYLVCSSEGEKLKPILVTVDYDEAASFMETDELVLDTTLPDALCVWLEQFVVTHYVPEAPKKRKRQKWFKDNDQAAS